MQTSLSQEFAQTPRGMDAEKILRNCVHCGFCNATCPTYQLLGDELDGPRGRIYQMKLLFEGAEPTREMQQHLDRCLTCRSCETTCPSGVRYSELLEIGREVLEEKLPRSGSDRWMRKLLTGIIPRRYLFATLMKLGQIFRGLAPSTLKKKMPKKVSSPEKSRPSQSHERRMMVLTGCAQPALSPNVNIATAQLLNEMGISLLEDTEAGCCGAVHLHTSEQAKGKQVAKNLIDVWTPYLDQGIEAFVMTASGCGVTVKEYPLLFRDDPIYYQKAINISEKTFDLSEIVAREQNFNLKKNSRYHRVAFHSPCTLQHGQQIRGKIEKILQNVGYELCEVRDNHLCCGSAGTYSILQPELSDQLRVNKQRALNANNPDVICTANIGCQTHLQTDSKTQVLHWVELLV